MLNTLKILKPICKAEKSYTCEILVKTTNTEFDGYLLIGDKAILLSEVDLNTTDIFELEHFSRLEILKKYPFRLLEEDDLSN